MHTHPFPSIASPPSSSLSHTSGLHFPLLSLSPPFLVLPFHLLHSKHMLNFLFEALLLSIFFSPFVAILLLLSFIAIPFSLWSLTYLFGADIVVFMRAASPAAAEGRPHNLALVAALWLDGRTYGPRPKKHHDDKGT